MKTRLFLTVWLVYSAHASTNVVREHYPAFALVKHGNFQVDEYLGLHSDIFQHTDGHAYINNNVASSVFASVPLFFANPILDAIESSEKARRLAPGQQNAPAYRIDKPMRQKFFHEVSARGLSMRFGAATLITSVFLIAPLSALCVIGVYHVLVQREVSRGLAIWLAFVFAFGTPLFFRSANLTANVFVFYATFASYYLLWGNDGRFKSATRLTMAGFFGGTALACDYSGMVPLICLFGYAILRQARQSSWPKALLQCQFFVLGSIIPVGFLVFSQWAMFGHLLWPAQYWMPNANYTEQGWRGFSIPSMESILLNLFHPSYGMYLFGPILVFGLLPLTGSRGKNHVTDRYDRIFTTALFVLMLLFCAANQYSRMQWNTGFRYLLPVVPFVFLMVCDCLVRWPRWAVVAVTLPAVVHTWALCMARDCNPNEDTWRLAPDWSTWLAALPAETVPASYARIWNDGLQLPWLRVLQLTTAENHKLLTQPWLPSAVIAGVGLLVGAVWSIARPGPPNLPVSRSISKRELQFAVSDEGGSQ